MQVYKMAQTTVFRYLQFYNPMAAMRTALQLRLFIALLCAASCCYGLPWVDSEDDMLDVMKEGDHMDGVCVCVCVCVCGVCVWCMCVVYMRCVWCVCGVCVCGVCVWCMCVVYVCGVCVVYVCGVCVGCMCVVCVVYVCGVCM